MEEFSGSSSDRISMVSISVKYNMIQLKTSELIITEHKRT